MPRVVIVDPDQVLDARAILRETTIDLVNDKDYQLVGCTSASRNAVQGNIEILILIGDCIYYDASSATTFYTIDPESDVTSQVIKIVEDLASTPELETDGVESNDDV